MNDTNNSSEQQLQQQATALHKTLSAYDAGAALSTPQQQQKSAAATVKLSSDEQVETISSTSREAAATQQPLYTLIKLPARINSSSTGNDSSLSASQATAQQQQQQHQQALSSATEHHKNQNCREHSEHVGQVPASQPHCTGVCAAVELEAKRRLLVLAADAMPTITDRNAAVLSSASDTEEETETRVEVENAAAAAATTIRIRNAPSINNNNNLRTSKLFYKTNNNDSRSNRSAAMVTRETLPGTVAAELAGATANSSSSNNSAVTGGTAAVNTAAENHKIILKLPKPTTSSNSATAAHAESHGDTDATTSGCSNSSNAEDTRKVEPLKINLHTHTHASLSAHSSHTHSSHAHTHHGQSGIVPKITIKPIVKQRNDASASDCSSSSAEDELPGISSLLRASNAAIPKLTIKSTTSVAASVTVTATAECSSAAEPHIVPKLTIRSASEEGGTSHTSIVPKLTIKMSDSSAQQASSLLSPTAAVASKTVANSPATPSTHLIAQAPQPPLPKLTIKTSLDGTSESIISTISPASSCYSSSSSSSSGSATTSGAASSFVATAAVVSCISSAAVANTTVPKLTIKTLCKSSEETVPKLTIKTHATGACVSTSETQQLLTEDSGGGGVAGGCVGSSNKIPKLTIKTGQEHAVIITQHNDASNAQAIPKLTIKTKSLDLEECSDDSPPEKIPKITIKTNELPAAEAPKFCIKAQQQQNEGDTSASSIPKLTISVTNLEASSAPQSPKQSPLVLRRQLTVCSRKPESPERVPKLMISRQDSLTVLNNHSDAVGSEKLVPKLTIKTNSLESGADAKDKLTKFAIKNNCSSAASSSSSAHQQEEEKIPKLTIKPIPPTQSQSSEESDECMSIASLPSPQAQQTNKVVPKLTIKNLCSPKLKIKAVFDDARTHATATETETASKKCSKSSDVKNVNEPNVSLDARSQNIPNTLNSEQCGQREQAPIISEHVANGGESSNSQEFCGFNDNTTDSTVEANAVSAAAEELRRHSDDMDIDEGLQQHDPQVFNNVTHFSVNNGLSFAGEHDDDDNAAELPTPGRMSHVIDTVDLTSSPSPGSSPAHFNYTDADPQVPTAAQLQKQAVPATLLMECLQRESSVIQTAPPTALQGENTSFLLNQLTAPRSAAAKHVPLPPLQPKPQQTSSVHCNNSVKYPQLTERLLANGALGLLSSSSSASSNIVVPCQVSGSPKNVAASKAETVIDSIEILDSPEGSPRYSLEEATAGYEEHAANANLNNHVHESIYISHTDSVDILKRNNNTVLEMHHANHVSLKRHANSLLLEKHMIEHDLEVIPNKLRRIENDTHTMATLTILTNDDESPNTKVFTTSPTMIRTHGADQLADAHFPSSPTTKQLGQISAPHRSRKQRHEHLLTMPIDEEDPLQLNSNDAMEIAPPPSNCYENNTKEAKAAAVAVAEAVTPLPIVKKRGRPKKVVSTPNDADLAASAEKAAKPKLSRVQLLRKRLAIDMVTSEQPPLTSEEMELAELDEDACETPSRRERTLRTPLRNSRRSATPSVPSEKPKKSNESLASGKKSKRPAAAAVAVMPLNEATLCHTTTTTTAAFNHFGGSNSSLSSACSSSSMSSNTLTTTAAAAMAGVVAGSGCSLSLATQIDLTMSSSSSSASNGSTTATMTTAQARCNSMLPPTTILSSSDPVPDVVFKANDFSCIMTAASTTLSRNIYRSASQDDTGTCGSGADNSGDDSTSSSPSTPTRGRGRGRGSRGGRSAGSARGTRGHRLGRGASAMAKAIASSRPRCVGGLKHTPDPHRLKGLFSPSPQVFEEDTRMSADLSQIAIQIQMEPHTPVKQPDFITNEESQSSMVSNTSILDPNLLASVQNGSAIKRPKKKKMEVCVAEDADFTVASIAEYDWPPPKGCCPSKNRDTFMIQEQVALYLGIKSFKRKYPDLPRRQVDMEERNWLQEKGLVTERMCDLGITAVWASDVLDIMYTDFYDKYEEYKDFIRQKHLREIEVKHKALGLNVTGRGLQARDRAMLSASKWNVYFNKTRKEERLSCLDLQTLTVNVPLPANAAGTTLVNRPIANAIACAAQAERIPEPPTLLKPRLCEQAPLPEKSYALALVPGQFAERYRQYTPLQLRSYPLNTVLDDPCTLPLRLQQQQLKQEEELLSESDVEAVAEATQASDAANANTGVGLTGVAAGADIAGVSRVTKRVPVRRSRRARMNAASTATAERTKSKCDTANADEQDEHSGHKRSLMPNNCSSSTEGSSSDDSTSETDSETDSYSSNSASSSSSSEDEMAPTLCGVCQHGQQNNLKKLPEVFIKCYTCRRKVHPSCIEMPHRMVARVRNYNWQCVDCKCCIKCKRKQDSNKMLYCEQCDRGFHIYCLGVRAVPDGRWSCERCSVCVRCGATKPEGLPPPQQQCLSSPNGEKIKPIKHKKVKWINEYRIDHITKLREHCSMLCVPCGRAKTTKRVQIVNSNLNCNGNNGSSSHGVATTAANTTTHLPTLAQQQTTPIILQQHLKLQQQQLLSHNATTQMSPPAAPLSQSAAATSAVTTSSIVATATLPPPPVVA